MSLARQEAYEVYYQSNGLAVAEPIADLKFLAGHIHTKISDGTLKPEKAVDLAVSAGVNALAITDHNNNGGAERARNYARNNGLENAINVLTGNEITTTDGHVLAIGHEGIIDSFKPAAHTIAEIHNMGGVAIIPHMDFPHIRSVSSDITEDLINNPQLESRPDGLEVFNASTTALQQLPIIGSRFREGSKEATKAFHSNHANTGAAFGGVDAHGIRMDQVLTGYRGEDPLDAIRRRETVVVFDPIAFGLRDNLLETTLLFMGVARVHGKDFIKRKLKGK